MIYSSVLILSNAVFYSKFSVVQLPFLLSLLTTIYCVLNFHLEVACSIAFAYVEQAARNLELRSRAGCG